MITKSNLESLDYNDVLLLPRESKVNSRSEINLVHDWDHDILPIMSSPMKNISSIKLVTELGLLGGIGIFHRFCSMDERKSAILLLEKSIPVFGVSIGIRNLEEELKLAEFAIGHGCRYICIDVANGYIKLLQDAVRSVCQMKNVFKTNIHIIAGNVVDHDGAYELARAGADFIRVGIGSGGLCSTRNVTGIGKPQLTAIMDCARIKTEFPRVHIISDGGIKSSGEAVKSFAFGADYVMVGSLFGKAIEAENNGVIYGMSSTRLQKEMGKITKSDEGLVVMFDTNEARPLSDIFTDFCHGIRSGLSYLGIKNIDDLQETTVEYISTGKNTLKSI